MKKTVSLLCAFSILLLLCSCADSESEATGSAKFDSMKTAVSKAHVTEFMELLSIKIAPDGLYAGCILDESHCFQVTPPQVAAETDMEIFKFSDSCASFVMVEDEIFELCPSFGGYGFVNAVPCDFDRDGNADLLVASSHGSGIHRSVISVFNSVIKESTVLYDTSTTAAPQTDLIVSASTPDFSSVPNEELPVYYQVYSISFTDTKGSDFAALSYVVNDVVGSIEAQNGTAVFVPSEK